MDKTANECRYRKYDIASGIASGSRPVATRPRRPSKGRRKPGLGQRGDQEIS